MLNKLLFIFILLGCSLESHSQVCREVSKYQIASALSMNVDLIRHLSLEIPSCGNIYLSKDFVGFILNDENIKLHNGIRSEIAIDFPYQEGDSIEYSWSMMLPSNGAPGMESDKWWVIAQWHDQPDPRNGETWASFRPQSPPLAVYVEKKNDVLGIGLMGPKGIRLNWNPIPKDIWLDVRMVVKWSSDVTGVATLTIEGLPSLYSESFGSNMLNHFQHYLKLGQYRAPEIRKYAVIYFKNIRIRTLNLD